MPMLAALAIAATLAPAPIQIVARSRSIQPGELVVLSITPAEPATRVRVRAFDHDIVAARDGDRAWRALVGIDLDVKPGLYVVRVDADGAHATYALNVKPRVFRTRRLTVNDAFVT